MRADMTRVPKKVEQRIKAELRKYQKILEAARARDLNESDTAIIVSNMLADIFGFDRFTDITTEYSIRSTYCDLAVKTDDKIHFLIEVKAIGKDLRDVHLRQAVDYATKEGVDWVILTNALEWEAYRVLFQKPIEHEMVFEMNLLEVSPKSADVVEKLYLLTKEGIKKSAIAAYHKE
ncbi:MAG: type I restriction enzyme HsdR N-terminal domain-containing protein, partial [bacterium]|nr:type I restriction enzyme HsdR N-terminal domain-containing protein [bacterium]